MRKDKRKEILEGGEAQEGENVEREMQEEIEEEHTLVDHCLLVWSSDLYLSLTYM